MCPNDGYELVPAATDPLIGQTIGTYRVIQRLGVGGMGAVYEAVETNIDKRVVLKIVHPHLSNDPRLPSLLAEAKAVNAIGDEGIVDIHGFGTLPDGRSYLVMELLEGELLEARLRAKGRLDLKEVLDLAAPLLQALEAAHSAGFVHRDIKTGNVFVVRRAHRQPFPKLLDFGIAHRTTAHSAMALGTPDYVAPEQAANRNVGPKADLYAFGCMLFELLTGQLPFVGTDGDEVVRLHQTAPRPSVRALRPELPEAIDALVLSLMQIEPAARPASAATVRHQVLELRSTLEPQKRRVWPLALAAAIALGTAGTVALWRSGTGTATPAADDQVALAAAKAARDVEAALEAKAPAALDKLLAAEAAFPGRSEWVALGGRLAAALRVEIQQALAADDADRAIGQLGALAKLGPLSADEPLKLQATRLSFALHHGMAHVGDVFVDRYEYPNHEGTPPVTGVDWPDAVKLCERAGKHLCTEEEWQTACAGPQHLKFPYGPSLEKGRCLSKKPKVKAPVVAGSFKRCAGAAGVFDLSGNVAEWTASAVREGEPQRIIRGGSFAQSDAKLACDARDYLLPGQGGAPHLGLRCCL